MRKPNQPITDDEQKQLNTLLNPFFEDIYLQARLDTVIEIREYLVKNGIPDDVIGFLNTLEEYLRGVKKDKKIDYREYINSLEWKVKAAHAKENAGWKCQLCNREGDNFTLHAHHRTYERLGKELDSDITVLCSDCHAKFHDKGGE